MKSPCIAILGFAIESDRFAPVSARADFVTRAYLQGVSLLDDARSDASVTTPESPAFVRTMDAVLPWTPVPILFANAESGGPLSAWHVAIPTTLGGLSFAATRFLSSPYEVMAAFTQGAVGRLHPACIFLAVASSLTEQRGGCVRHQVDQYNRHAGRLSRTLRNRLATRPYRLLSRPDARCCRADVHVGNHSSVREARRPR